MKFSIHCFFKMRLPLLMLITALIGIYIFGSEFHIELAEKAIIFAIFAMSLDLLVGYTGLVSFGHAAYFGIAAYAVALIAPEYSAVNLWLVMFSAVAISALVALVVGVFVLRTKGIYFIMVTLAFSQMFYYLFHDSEFSGGTDGIYLNFHPSTAIFGWSPFDLSEASHLYAFMAVILILVYLFLSRILQSFFGRVLEGIRINESRMLSLGYQTFYYKLAAFSLAGGIAGMAGSLYAVLFGFITPELLSWHESGNVLLMVILGGMGNFFGAIMGAVTFIAMEEFFSAYTKHWLLLMGGSIVLIVLFLPGGICAIPRYLKEKFKDKE